MTWTERGAGMAFLAIDENHNQRIDDGSELFGKWTVLQSGTRAGNGFEALRELDSNSDGRVDRRDERWEELLLWVDANHDAVSQREELSLISSSAVHALETAYHWTGRRDAFGNYFRYAGRAHFERGTKPMYDIYFAAVP